MGWKEVWEKYQVAAAFAEAGEEKTALDFLEDGGKEPASPGKEANPAPEQGGGLLRPSPVEG